MNQVTFTCYTSTKPLTKIFTLVDGEIEKQAAAQMSTGQAERVTLPFSDFSRALTSSVSNEAFGYGITDDLLHKATVDIATKGRENEAKGVVSRTKDFFQYRGPGILMIDHDTSEYGQTFRPNELLAALGSVHPEINGVRNLIIGTPSKLAAA